MGKRVVRLTEADLEKIINKVLSEQRKEKTGKDIQPITKTFNIINSFESGQYKLKNTPELQKVVKEIKSLMSEYDMSKAIIDIVAGESKVPNPKGFGEGDLAKARANEFKKFLENELGVKVRNIETKIGTTDWDANKGKDHPDYQREQFVNLNIEIDAPSRKQIVEIVPNPRYGMDPSGIKTFVGFTDGTMFSFDKNDQTQRNMMVKFNRIPDLDNFRKNRINLDKVCKRYQSMCDNVEYDMTKVIEVKDENTLNQLIDRVKQEKLLFPIGIQNKELK